MPEKGAGVSLKDFSRDVAKSGRGKDLAGERWAEGRGAGGKGCTRLREAYDAHDGKAAGRGQKTGKAAAFPVRLKGRWGDQPLRASPVSGRALAGSSASCLSSCQTRRSVMP